MARARNVSAGADARLIEAIGESETFVAFQEQLSRVATVDRPVLICGERGTGKELAAHRLHYLSRRWDRPFVALNCAALAPTLIESELFGYEAGAFTGATQPRAGRFEAAHEGTLFLDEIGNIPLEVQQKILRVVEYGSFERVGSARATQVDARIVGATHADLKTLATDGRFLRDLLDRLSFEVLFLPPLRERGRDVMLLANHFAARMAFELGREEIPQFSDAAVAALEQHPWPGNVRELKNVIERAVYRADGAVISVIDFDPFRSPFAAAASPLAPAVTIGLAPTDAGADEAVSFKGAISACEVRLVADALRRARFNQHRAAELLGLSYDQFRGLYRKYRREIGGSP